MQAEQIAPTVDTLTWEEAVTLGSQAWESAEQSKWDLGDVGAIVAHKWHDDSIKKFANSIGMHDNPRRLYEYVQVAQHYPKSARALFPNTTWSAYRECSRHGLTLEQSLDALAKHGDKPVAAIREAIGGQPPAPRLVRREFECDANTEICDPAELATFQALANEHVVKYFLVIEWTEPTPAPQS